MKQFFLCLLLLAAFSVEATFTNPFGAEILGAGTTFGSTHMKNLISRYNTSYPCPQIIYKQKPVLRFAGSENGLSRVLDDSVTFAVSTNKLSAQDIEEISACLLEIPFILGSLSIIYNLPADFPTNPLSNWPGHLNISPADLCAIYTAGTLNWGGAGTTGLLNKLYNGNQTYNPPATQVRAYARGDSCDETALFAFYLDCSGTSCTQFATALDPKGPFCSGTAPTWNVSGLNANVTCLSSNDAIAQAVLTNRGTIGYVGTDAAFANGFTLSSGPTAGIPTGIAGLFIEGSTYFTSPQQNPQDNAANYTQPTISAVQNAAINCSGGYYLCIDGAYPIVDMELFVLKAIQPIALITCNISQFIQFALTEGQKIPGFAGLPGDCITQSLALLDKLSSLICDPCIEPCNPCLNQSCPLPCIQPCKV